MYTHPPKLCYSFDFIHCLDRSVSLQWFFFSRSPVSYGWICVVVMIICCLLCHTIIKGSMQYCNSRKAYVIMFGSWKGKPWKRGGTVGLDHCEGMRFSHFVKHIIHNHLSTLPRVRITWSLDIWEQKLKHGFSSCTAMYHRLLLWSNRCKYRMPSSSF